MLIISDTNHLFSSMKYIYKKKEKEKEKEKRVIFFFFTSPSPRRLISTMSESINGYCCMSVSSVNFANLESFIVLEWELDLDLEVKEGFNFASGKRILLQCNVVSFIVALLFSLSPPPHRGTFLGVFKRCCVVNFYTFFLALRILCFEIPCPSLLLPPLFLSLVGR